MKLSTLAVWSAVPLTIIGLLVSFLIAVSGAGHGDKTLILLIFPIPLIVWTLGGFLLGIVTAFLQFPIYALLIRVAAKRRWGWSAAGAVFLIHLAIYSLFWFLKSA